MHATTLYPHADSRTSFEVTEVLVTQTLACLTPGLYHNDAIDPAIFIHMIILGFTLTYSLR